MAPFPQQTLIPRGSGLVSYTNRTIDDTNAGIIYNGFSLDKCGSGNCIYDGTVHEATTAGATATFTFVGTDLYFYGRGGPEYGRFTVQIDGNSNTYDANTECPAIYAPAFLLGIHGLSQGTHNVVLTTCDEGKTVALDSITYTTTSASAAGSNEGTPGTTIVIGGGQYPQPTGYVQTYSTPIATITTTDVFGQVGTSVIYGPATTTVVGTAAASKPSKNNAGAIAGGVVGVLIFLVIIWMVLNGNESKKSKADSGGSSDKSDKKTDDPEPAA